MEIVFLTLEDVLMIHSDQLHRYGGRKGIRDRGLLLSALSMPEASFGGEYVHPDLPAMAAAYIFHIVQNHPFLDGNKRVGLVVALLFLHLNGLHLACSKDDVENLVWSLAQGRCEKDKLIEFFRRNTVPS